MPQPELVQVLLSNQRGLTHALTVSCGAPATDYRDGHGAAAGRADGSAAARAEELSFPPDLRLYSAGDDRHIRIWGPDLGGSTVDGFTDQLVCIQMVSSAHSNGILGLSLVTPHIDMIDPSHHHEAAAHSTNAGGGGGANAGGGGGNDPDDPDGIFSGGCSGSHEVHVDVPQASMRSSTLSLFALN